MEYKVLHDVAGAKLEEQLNFYGADGYSPLFVTRVKTGVFTVILQKEKPREHEYSSAGGRG
jgi:hypothetical protein